MKKILLAIIVLSFIMEGCNTYRQPINSDYRVMGACGDNHRSGKRHGG